MLADTLSISEKQLDLLRLLQNEDGESLADNFRPVQDNQNRVYYCSPEYDFPLSFNDNIFELNVNNRRSKGRKDKQNRRSV